MSLRLPAQPATYCLCDCRRSRHWAKFASSALEHGIRTTLSLPLASMGEPTGALNLYSRHLGRFEGSDTRAAETLAAQAGVVLANARAFHEYRDLSENLRDALTSRSTIDYAIGIIVATGGH